MISPKRPHVLFAPDCGREIGGGHVMRSLSLAAALTPHGVESVFALEAEGAAIAGQFARSPVKIVSVTGEGDLLALAASQRWAAVVVDSYRLNLETEAALVRHTGVLVALDDLANRPHVAQILLDASFGRRLADYDALVPPNTERLIGPAYALLRPEFAAFARFAREFPGSITRVFVSFGLSDVEGITATAVERLLRLTQADIHVAVAGNALSLPKLHELRVENVRLKLHVDAREIAAIMASCDVAVGAGGTSTWERMALALPTLAVVVAENQREMVRRLVDVGVVTGADLSDGDFAQRFDSAFLELEDAGVRRRLARSSASLCDGKGAERVARTITSRFT